MHPKQVEETDVVILGGGPAGLSAAWAAAKTGAKTVLLEKAPEIGSVVRTSGGTVIESLKGLGINENLYQPVSSVVLLGKTTHIEKTSEHPLYAILEVAPLYKHLGRRAEEAGAEIRVQTKGKLLQEAGTYIGVETNDRQIRAKITIDATGGWCENGDKAPRRALGLEIVAHTGCDKAVLIMDEVATYGWLFPEKSGKSRIGVGVIKPDRDTNLPAELQRITDELSRRLGIPSIDTTDPSYERHAGSYPIRGNYKKHLTKPGLLIVGDAGPGGSNLAGEGIRFAITGGRMAGTVAGQYATGTRADTLGYERAFSRKYGFAYKLAQAVNLRISGWNENDWDKALKMTENLKPETLSKAMATELDTKLFLELARQSPKVIAGFIAAGVQAATRKAAL